MEVEGTNHMQMIVLAKRTAAIFLSEPFANLVAEAGSMANPTAYSRFQLHLGASRAPIRWSMRVTIRLDPKIVKKRREHAREIARAELTRIPEDGE